MIAKLSSLVGLHSLPAQRLAIQKKTRYHKSYPSCETKQLLIDVSVIIKQDAHTGIQRVVRALLLQLFKNPPHGYRIVPVYCTRKHFYQYAGKDFVERFGPTPETILIGDVIVSSGDLFFGLDLTAHLLPHHEDALLQWKKQGVKIFFLVYDMLPHLHPEWFTSHAVKNFRRWLRTISVYSNRLICISESVKNDLKSWLKAQGFSDHTPRSCIIHLGADFEESLPSRGIDFYSGQVLKKLRNKKFIMIVGTLEPRKGHSDLLDAMEVLWANGNETSLVIVGKVGWKTKQLQKRILTHIEVEKKLFWLQQVSDETLDILYAQSLGVVIASYGEGFGLPLLEALKHSKPILARNLNVYHDLYEKLNLPSNTITYFNLLNNQVLELWLNSNFDIVYEKIYTNFNWKESYKELVKCLKVREDD